MSYAYPDGTAAVHGATLSVAGGEMVALTGGHEAGKSTLLRLAAGDLQPANGSVAASGPVGWLLPAVELQPVAAAEQADWGRLWSVADWCSQPGAVLVADHAAEGTTTNRVLDQYAASLVEARTRGAAVLVATHSMEVSDIADRLVCLDSGRVVEMPARPPLWPDRFLAGRFRFPEPEIANAIADGRAWVLIDWLSGRSFAVAFHASVLAEHVDQIRWLVADAGLEARLRYVADRTSGRCEGPRVERRRRLLDGCPEPAGTPMHWSEPQPVPVPFQGQPSANWTTFRPPHPAVLSPDVCAAIIECGVPLLHASDLSPRRADEADIVYARDGVDLMGGPLLARMETIVHVANEAFWRFDLRCITLKLLRYRPGHRHTDHADVFPACTTLKLSASVQLSAPTSYAGGMLQALATEIGATRSTGWCDAPREQGSAIVFPSYTRHRVTEVTAGERWALVIWAWGPPLR